MKIGKFGQIKEGFYKDHIVLRADSSIWIDLTDPEYNWTNGITYPVDARILLVGTTLELVIGNSAI
jgi:hypothetical protein